MTLDAKWKSRNKEAKMAAKCDIDYELTGDVNNARVHLKGRGVADFDKGLYDIELQLLSVPFYWDPPILVMMCCDRIVVTTTREIGDATSISTVSPDGCTVNWRGAYLYDERGRHAGHVSASSTGRRIGNLCVSRSQLLGGDLHLNLEEEITEIETPYHGVMQPFGKDIVLVTAAYSFRTNQQNRYWGYTTYPYRTRSGRTIARPQRLTVEKVEIDRSQKDTMRLAVTSSVEPFDDATQSTGSRGSSSGLGAR